MCPNGRTASASRTSSSDICPDHVGHPGPSRPWHPSTAQTHPHRPPTTVQSSAAAPPFLHSFLLRNHRHGQKHCERKPKYTFLHNFPTVETRKLLLLQKAICVTESSGFTRHVLPTQKHTKEFNYRFSNVLFHPLVVAQT